MTLYLQVSGEPPMPPPDADFSFRIVFEKGQGDPRRIFDAASELIDGFEHLDEAIAGSADATIRPLMVLEDIEAGSIRVWLSSFLKTVDDQGLREGEWKKAIGPALASNIRQLGDYAPIHEAKLLAALDSFQDAKRLLGLNDKLMLEAPSHKTYEVDLTKTWDPSEVITPDKTTTEKHSEGEIILTIRKPDMTGKSKWQFTRGKFPIFAKITHQEWLKKFHDRKVEGFHSGDAMRCRVKFTYVFDEKGTMLEEQIEIIEVLEIIDGSGGEQLPML
jgi:hypothetical protein